MKKELLGQYRQWNENYYGFSVFKIDQYDEEDNDYYCKHEWYELDYWFDKQIILDNSKEISYWKYLYFKWFK